MAKVSVYNIEGKEVDTIELNDAVFGVEVNEHLVHMAVVNQLANNRQGTQKAKTRSEVSGGGRKPWRQKGTGHARQGSTRAPQWTGGGVVFAPVPRDYSFKMNKKEKRAALKSALTSRVEENKFIVVDELKFDEIKTKNIQNVLNNLNVNKALVVLEDGNTNVEISAKNIPDVKTARTNTINVYDVLKYNTVIAQHSYRNESCCCCNRGGVRIMANVQYYDVILKPVITEKSMDLMADRKYTFLVHTDATKNQIKEAVEKMFEGTKVQNVNTMNLDGKNKRRGMTFGKTAKTKKAIVQLTEDSKEIEIFAGL